MEEKLMTEAEKNRELRRNILEVTEEIAGDVDHGECFYESEMLDEFLGNLDKLKSLANAYYLSNQKELQE